MNKLETLSLMIILYLKIINLVIYSETYFSNKRFSYDISNIIKLMNKKLVVM